jgi:hypothetical protein
LAFYETTPFFPPKAMMLALIANAGGVHAA